VLAENEEVDVTKGNGAFMFRFAFRYLEHEMPDADAETIERATRDFLAALQD